LQHDVIAPLETERPIDIVLHLASPASPKDYLNYPIETLRVGAWGTYHLLDLARKKSATFLLASTSEVYGDPEVHPQQESYWGKVNPVGPRSVYDESKRYAESLTMAYHRHHKLDVRIARIFNTYGPRMRLDDGRVLPNFMMQALQNEALTVFGDGTQTRSLCHVDDLVEGLWRLLTIPYAHRNGNPCDEPLIVNLGNPDEISILDLAGEIIEITHSKSTIAYEPLPQDDPTKRQPDIGRAREVLHWAPMVSRQHGLKRVAPYFEALAHRQDTSKVLSK